MFSPLLFLVFWWLQPIARCTVKMLTMKMLTVTMSKSKCQQWKWRKSEWQTLCAICCDCRNICKEKVVIPICVFQHREQSCTESGQSQCAHSCQWGFWFVYLELRNVCVSVAESCQQLRVRVLIVELCRQIHQAVKFVHLSDS